MSRKARKSANLGDPMHDFSVEWWPVDRPKPYAGNPRQIGEDAIAKVAASLSEFGWRQPIVVDADEEIVVGHTRLLAARHLGLDQVPVHVAADLTPEQAKAYRLADNKAGEFAAWDDALLGVELADLGKMGVDLDGLGFAPGELTAMTSWVDQQAAFLGDMESAGKGDDDGTANGEADEEATAAPGTVNLLLVLRKEDRAAVLEWLNSERDRRGLATTSEALTALAREATSERVTA